MVCISSPTPLPRTMVSVQISQVQRVFSMENRAEIKSRAFLGTKLDLSVHEIVGSFKGRRQCSG